MVNLDKYIKMFVVQLKLTVNTSMWYDEEKGLRSAYTIRRKGKQDQTYYSKARLVQELAKMAEGK